jgi:phosphatidylserine decarboxylase
MTTFAAILAVLICGASFYWRYVWFLRNPQRVPPNQPAILSPADGTVVYVKQIDPQLDVLVIKKCRAS